MRSSVVLAALALGLSLAGIVGTQAVTSVLGWDANVLVAGDATPAIPARTPSLDPTAAEPSDPPRFKVSQESKADTLVAWLDWLAAIWKPPFGASPH